MSDSTTAKVRTLEISDLFRGETEVNTSIGLIYVRYTRLSDLDMGSDLADEEMGRVVLQHLCGLEEDRENVIGLSEELMASLNSDDLSLLVAAVAQQDDLVLETGGSLLADLGRAWKTRHDEIKAGWDKTVSQLRTSLDISPHVERPSLPDLASLQFDPAATTLGRATLQSAAELEQIKKLTEQSTQGSQTAERLARHSLRIAFITLVVTIIAAIVSIISLAYSFKSNSENLRSQDSVSTPRTMPSKEEPKTSNASASPRSEPMNLGIQPLQAVASPKQTAPEQGAAAK